uniref:Uncharacterized protein n=1 Tax=Glossina palpalis gambiensis TaxID=67801 RepID=A0A1B0AU46_9MUSC
MKGVLLGLDENIGFEDYLVVPENYESMRQSTTCRDGKVFTILCSIVTHSKIFALSLGRDRTRRTSHVGDRLVYTQRYKKTIIIESKIHVQIEAVKRVQGQNNAVIIVLLNVTRSKNVLDATFHLPPSRWHGICKSTYSLERVTTKSEKQKQLMSHV